MGDFYTEWLEQSVGETGLQPEYHDERYYGKCPLKKIPAAAWIFLLRKSAAFVTLNVEFLF